MKKTLATLRSKSPEVRLAVAFGLAIFFTGLIAAGWAMTLGGNKNSRSKAPSPLNALTGAIKDVVVKPSGSNAEIIDAGADAAYDESNPYQSSSSVPVQTQTTTTTTTTTQ